jgi:hypothetical protein
MGSVGAGVAVVAVGAVAVVTAGPSAAKPGAAEATATTSPAPSAGAGTGAPVMWDKDKDVWERLPGLLNPLLPQGLSISAVTSDTNGPAWMLTGPSGTNNVTFAAGKKADSWTESRADLCAAGGVCSRRAVTGGTLYIQRKNFQADYGGADLYAAGHGKDVLAVNDEYTFVPDDADGYVYDLQENTNTAHEVYSAQPPKDWTGTGHWPPTIDSELTGAFNAGGELISADQFLALVQKPDYAKVAQLLDPSTPASAEAAAARRADNDKIAAALKPVLPSGLTVTIDTGSVVGALILAGPSGTNSFQWTVTPKDPKQVACEYQAAKDCVQTKVPGGTVSVEDRKTGVQDPAVVDTPTDETTDYTYTPDAAGAPLVKLTLNEQFKDIQWATAVPTTGRWAGAKTRPSGSVHPGAFNATGPLLTLEQFTALGQNPGIADIVATVNAAGAPPFSAKP